MIVCIDPGHGGKDPGAIGRHPWGVVREVDVAWAVSMVVLQVLQGPEADRWHPVTRRSIEGLSLRERVRRINSSHADVVVSIHCNSASNSSARGFETLHYGSEQGEELALSVHKVLQVLFAGTRPSIPDRGVKVRRNLRVLRDTSMPAVLVELPFVSNQSDASMLVSSRLQVTAGTAIAVGVANYLGRAS